MEQVFSEVRASAIIIAMPCVAGTSDQTGWVSFAKQGWETSGKRRRSSCVQELFYVLGHEIGHIKSGHTLWISLIAPLGTNTNRAILCPMAKKVKSALAY